MELLPFWGIYLFVFLIGLCLGSFATAAAYRIPLGKSFISGRSACPSCNKTLGIVDLVPLLSWFMLRGKCRQCGAKIGARYVLTEIGLAVLITLIYHLMGITPVAAVLMLLTVCIVITMVIDFEHLIIPDGLNLSMFALGVIYHLLLGTEWYHFVTGPLTGLMIGFLLRWLMFVWKKTEGLGMGDVKFLAVVGLFLPLELFPTFFFLSGVLGMCIAMVWRMVGKGQMFPFGPALTMALYICLVVPEFHNDWQTFVQSLLVYWVE